MKLTKISEAIMNATRVAKVCREQIVLSACIGAVICLSPAAAEDSQEMKENAEELVENVENTEVVENGEKSEIDYAEETTAALQEAELEDVVITAEDVKDEDEAAVELIINSEEQSDTIIVPGTAGGSGGVATPLVEAEETDDTANNTQDDADSAITGTLNPIAESSEEASTDYSVSMPEDSDSDTSASISGSQQKLSKSVSSTEEDINLSTASTQQNNSSVYLVSGGNDTGISTSSSSGYSYGATASTESAAPVSEIQDIVITNQDVASGEVLAAKQTIIAQNITPNVKPPDRIIKIADGGQVQVGDADSTGILYLTRSETATDKQGTSITDTLISVTGDEKLVDVRISSKDEFSSTASMTYVDLDLTQLKENLCFTIEHATVSASRINQTSGEMHLVNHAGVSLVEGS